MTWASLIESADWLIKTSLLFAGVLSLLAVTGHARLRLLALRCALVVGLLAPLALIAPTPRAVAVPLRAAPPALAEVVAAAERAEAGVAPILNAPVVIRAAASAPVETSAPAAVPASSPVGPATPSPGLVLTLTWIAGGLLVILSFLRSLWTLNLTFRSGRAAPGLQARLDALATRMGVRGPVSLRLSDQVASPCAFGLARARVLIPSRLADASETTLEAMMVHELAHIRARDPLWLAISRLACAVHWFNPLAWALDRRHREVMETVCDDAVLEASVSLSDYAQALVEATRAGRPGRETAGAAVSMSLRAVHDRLRYLMRDDRRAGRVDRKGRGLAYGVSTVALAFLTSVNLVAAQETPQAPIANLAPSPAIAPSGDDCGCTDTAPALENADLPRLNRSQLNDRAQIEALIHSGSAQERAAALLALGDWPRAGAAPLIQTALRDPDARVRAAAQSTLAKWADRNDYAAVAGGLDDASCRVATASARGLSRLGDRRGLNPLLGAARSPACRKRLAAVEALAGFPTPETASALHLAMQDADPRVRAAAIGSLESVGDGRQVPDLIAAMRSDPNDQVRSAAAWAFRNRDFGAAGDPRVIAALTETMLTDSHPQARQGAASALARVGDRTALPALLTAAADPNKHIRQAATEALGRVGDRAAQPILMRLTEDPEPHVRYEAAVALGRVGDAQARPSLQRLIDDPDKPVREVAENALRRLAG